MSRVIAALALIAVIAGALGLAAPREDDRTMRWAAAPRVVRPPALPRDRVLTAEIRNESSRPLHLVAARVRVLDTRGRLLRSAARFADAYVPEPAARAVTLAPGDTAPLTVAWRGSGARSVAIGPARLKIAG